jgi:hypothetical protein
VWTFAANRSYLVATLAALLLVTSSLPAQGVPCVQSCKRNTRDCIAEKCGALRGQEGRDCRKTCRGRHGCTLPPIGTLAYVVTECHVLRDRGLIGRQSLRIRRGNCDDVTISYCTAGENLGHPCIEDADCGRGICGGVLPLSPLLAPGCELLGEFRLGNPAQVAGIFQRFGVSPDGSTVVFEVAPLGLFPPLTDTALLETAERLGNFGTYSVRADGTGLRRLGGAGRTGPWDQIVDGNEESGFPFGLFVGYRGFNFSPNGRTVVLTDLGPSDAGVDAFQVVTLDVASGERTVLTRLPPALSTFAPTSQLRPPRPGPTPIFIDDRRILFLTLADTAAGVRRGTYMRVRTDGRGLKPVRTPEPPTGSSVHPTFSIFAGPRNLLTVFADEIPRKVHAFGPLIEGEEGFLEVYLSSGKDLLQLTAFRRDDTFAGTMAADGRRAFFVASENLDGRNPTENCQLFSADVISGRFRQLTMFREVEEGATSESGCYPGREDGGCRVGQVMQDPANGTLLFLSSCDPFGTNPNGEEVFAVRPDGSGLRQLTHTRGRVEPGDGSVEIELPGPWSYSTPVQPEEGV